MLIVAVVVVLLVRKGTVGRNLAAMRGSETATAGLGVNPTWQRIVVFALSGAIAGVGGVLYSIQQQLVSPDDWNTSLLAGPGRARGHDQRHDGGRCHPGRHRLLRDRADPDHRTSRRASAAPSLTIVLFAFGALTYAQHPEGVLEYQKRRSTMRFERLFFAREAEAEDRKARAMSASGANG